MATKPILILICDRCGEETGRQDIPEGDTPRKPVPAYFRQILGADDRLDSKQLDVLCGKCKKDVATLDERIFSKARTRQTNEGGTDGTQ